MQRLAATCLAALLAMAAGPAPSVESRDAFLLYAARSYSESRSGDLVAIPGKHNLLANHDYSFDGFSHVRDGGQVRTVRHEGIVHGTPWSYDTRIPIVLYGPGFIRPGQVSDASATQQDLAPTVAALIGAPAPEDTRGRVLHEAFRGDVAGRKPRAVLTLVFDQAGLENYYEVHPEAWPEVKALMARGTYYPRARVTHIDGETAVGHAAIGTGAYPAQHGIVSNNFWRRDLGWPFPAFESETRDTPATMLSPALADTWNRFTGNKGIVVSYCYAARAAVGMAGHGRMYSRDSHTIMVFYDDNTGRLKSNELYYDLPPYLAELSPLPYWQEATGGTNTWMEHRFNAQTLFRQLPLTPAFARFDADVFLRILEREPIGQDDVPDLLYLTLKSTDACGHAFGSESEECAEVFRVQDAQAARVIRALEAKVGTRNVVVILTADHGGPPLPELKGGQRLRDGKLIEDLNTWFDRLDNGVPLVRYITGTQVFLDDAEMARNGVRRDDVKGFLAGYRVAGKPFFFAVFTKDEVRRARAAAGLM